MSFNLNTDSTKYEVCMKMCVCGCGSEYVSVCVCQLQIKANLVLSPFALILTCRECVCLWVCLCVCLFSCLICTALGVLTVVHQKTDQNHETLI